MKLVIRLSIAAIVFIATNGLVFLAWNALLVHIGLRWLPKLLSLACAMLAAQYAWRNTADLYGGRVRYAVGGALITGAFGFAAGFCGPIIFSHGANQGPLLGMFTGLLGLLVGAAIGAIYWKRSEGKQPWEHEG